MGEGGREGVAGEREWKVEKGIKMCERKRMDGVNFGEISIVDWKLGETKDEGR